MSGSILYPPYTASPDLRTGDVMDVVLANQSLITSFDFDCSYRSQSTSGATALSCAGQVSDSYSDGIQCGSWNSQDACGASMTVPDCTASGGPWFCYFSVILNDGTQINTPKFSVINESVRAITTWGSLPIHLATQTRTSSSSSSTSVTTTTLESSSSATASSTASASLAAIEAAERHHHAVTVGAAAGGTVGGLAVMLAVLLCCFCFRRRKERKDSTDGGGGEKRSNSDVGEKGGILASTRHEQNIQSSAGYPGNYASGQTTNYPSGYQTPQSPLDFISNASHASPGASAGASVPLGAALAPRLPSVLDEEASEPRDPSKPSAGSNSSFNLTPTSTDRGNAISKPVLDYHVLPPDLPPSTDISSNRISRFDPELLAGGAAMIAGGAASRRTRTRTNSDIDGFNSNRRPRSSQFDRETQGQNRHSYVAASRGDPVRRSSRRSANSAFDGFENDTSANHPLTAQRVRSVEYGQSVQPQQWRQNSQVTRPAPVHRSSQNRASFPSGPSDGSHDRNLASVDPSQDQRYSIPTAPQYSPYPPAGLEASDRSVTVPAIDTALMIDGSDNNVNDPSHESDNMGSSNFETNNVPTGPARENDVSTQAGPSVGGHVSPNTIRPTPSVLGDDLPGLFAGVIARTPPVADNHQAQSTRALATVPTGPHNKFPNATSASRGSPSMFHDRQWQQYFKYDREHICNFMDDLIHKADVKSTCSSATFARLERELTPMIRGEVSPVMARNTHRPTNVAVSQDDLHPMELEVFPPSQSPHYTIYDLLGWCLSKASEPQPSDATDENYYLPLLTLYSKWCFLIGGSNTAPPMVSLTHIGRSIILSSSLQDVVSKKHIVADRRKDLERLRMPGIRSSQSFLELATYSLGGRCQQLLHGYGECPESHAFTAHCKSEESMKTSMYVLTMTTNEQWLPSKDGITRQDYVPERAGRYLKPPCANCKELFGQIFGYIPFVASEIAIAELQGRNLEFGTFGGEVFNGIVRNEEEDRSSKNFNEGFGIFDDISDNGSSDDEQSSQGSSWRGASDRDGLVQNVAFAAAASQSHGNAGQDIARAAAASASAGNGQRGSAATGEAQIGATSDISMHQYQNPTAEGRAQQDGSGSAHLGAAGASSAHHAHESSSGETAQPGAAAEYSMHQGHETDPGAQRQHVYENTQSGQLKRGGDGMAQYAAAGESTQFSTSVDDSEHGMLQRVAMAGEQYNADTGSSELVHHAGGEENYSSLSRQEQTDSSVTGWLSSSTRTTGAVAGQVKASSSQTSHQAGGSHELQMLGQQRMTSAGGQRSSGNFLHGDADATSYGGGAELNATSYGGAGDFNATSYGRGGDFNATSYGGDAAFDLHGGEQQVSHSSLMYAGAASGSGARMSREFGSERRARRSKRTISGSGGFGIFDNVD